MGDGAGGIQNQDLGLKAAPVNSDGHRKGLYSGERSTLQDNGILSSYKNRHMERGPIQRASYKKCGKFYNSFMPFSVIPPEIATSQSPTIPFCQI